MKTATTHTPSRCAVIMTLWAWSSVMRNSAFRTVTTNSRGVKSSLTRMSLSRRGRSVLVLTLVFGLVTVSVMPASTPDAFAISPPEYNPLAGRGTGCFAMASLQRWRCAQVGNDIDEVGVFEAGIVAVGHRRLERPPLARHVGRGGAAEFRLAPGGAGGGAGCRAGSGRTRGA